LLPLKSDGTIDLYSMCEDTKASLHRAIAGDPRIIQALGIARHDEAPATFGVSNSIHLWRSARSQQRTIPTQAELSRADSDAQTILLSLNGGLPRRYNNLIFNAAIYLFDRDAYIPQKRSVPLPHDLGLEIAFFDATFGPRKRRATKTTLSRIRKHETEAGRIRIGTPSGTWKQQK
jgi:hypothetical protein